MLIDLPRIATAYIPTLLRPPNCRAVVPRLSHFTNRAKNIGPRHRIPPADSPLFRHLPASLSAPTLN
jgi:hypothetical protein